MSKPVDDMRLIFDASGAFALSRTPKELDDVWAKVVRPFYDQLDENALALLHRLYALNMTVLLKNM
jgi:hypothetical protein